MAPSLGCLARLPTWVIAHSYRGWGDPSVRNPAPVARWFIRRPIRLSIVSIPKAATQILPIQGNRVSSNGRAQGLRALEKMFLHSNLKFLPTSSYLRWTPIGPLAFPFKQQPPPKSLLPSCPLELHWSHPSHSYSGWTKVPFARSEVAYKSPFWPIVWRVSPWYR